RGLQPQPKETNNIRRQQQFMQADGFDFNDAAVGSNSDFGGHPVARAPKKVVDSRARLSYTMDLLLPFDG
ncbi:MAG TPA: hypothetical protein VJT82_07020, partial [Pyrinomonadaceae bacterium]|nr:hypothetical protein [Pyrinomonadaceae bacterium]